MWIIYLQIYSLLPLLKFYPVQQHCSRALHHTVLFCEICSILYYEHLQPPPMALETQDEILLSNLPPTWQLVCDNEIDRPIPLNSAIYAVINRDDLCTCGILAQHVFLYESIHTCANPDAVAAVILYIQQCLSGL